MGGDSVTPKADGPVEVSIDEHGRVTTTVEELQRVRDGWALAIGRFMVAFAGCEYWTYQYIWTYGSAAESDVVGRQGLSQRLAVVKRVLLRMGLKPEVQKRVTSVLQRLRKLTATRNVLAHNAPMVHVYRHEQTGAMEVRHELRNATDPSRGVTVAQLENEAAEATQVEEELALLFGVVRQSERRLT